LLTQQSLEVARHDVPVGSPQQLSGTAGQDRQFCPPPSPRRGGGWQPRARGCSRLVSSIRPRHSSCTHLSAQTRGFAQQSGTTSSARPTSTMRTCRCGKAPWPITCAPLGLHALHSRATTTVPAMCLAWYTTNSPELLAKHDGPCRTRTMSSKRETSRALFLGVLRRHLVTPAHYSAGKRRCNRSIVT